MRVQVGTLRAEFELPSLRFPLQENSIVDINFGFMFGQNVCSMIGTVISDSAVEVSNKNGVVEIGKPASQNCLEVPTALKRGFA